MHSTRGSSPLICLPNVIPLLIYVLVYLSFPTNFQPFPVCDGAPTTSSPSLTPSLRNLPYRKRDDSVIIYLADGNPQRITDFVKSLAALDTYFNNYFDYPVLIFYSVDDEETEENGDTDRKKDGSDTSKDPPHPKVPVITPEQQRYLQSQTLSALTFVPIRLASYSGSVSSVAGSYLNQASPILHGRFTIGYRHMCNFFAGPIAFESVLAPFRYYWRFDTDSFLASTIPYDVFMHMARNSYKYGWATKQCDWPTVTKGLYDIAYETFHTPEQPLINKLETDMKDSTCPKGTDTDTPYNSRIYYNNFEIVDLEFLRSPAYQTFYYRIAQAGGIYTHRWGDAPIRTLAVRALLPPSAIHHFNDISYWHQNIYGPLATYAIIGGIALSIGLISTILYCIYVRSRPMNTNYSARNGGSSSTIEGWRSWLGLTYDNILRCLPSSSFVLYFRSLLVRYSLSSSSSSSHKPTWTMRILFILYTLLRTLIESIFCIRFRWLTLGVSRLHAKSNSLPSKGLPSFSSSSASSATFSFLRNASCTDIKNRSFLTFGFMVTVVLWLYSRSRLHLWPEQQLSLSSSSSSSSTSSSTPTSNPTLPTLDYLRCRSDDLDCLLATRANPQKEIVVTAVSEGALPFLTNLIRSWRTVNLHNYIVFALDAPSAEYLHQRNIPTYWDPAPLASYMSCRWQERASQAYTKAFTVSPSKPSRSSVPETVSSSPFQPCTPDEVTAEKHADPSLVSGLAEVMDSSKGNFKYNSAGFVTVTHRKNEVVLEVLKRGYISFFTDADTVWLRNVLNDPSTREEGLNQPCNSLRLGDTINFAGDYPTHIANRNDCGSLSSSSSSLTPYPFDVKGMYGDSGGMDTGFWYMRNTTASINHMRAVVQFQRQNPSALTMNDQDTYNHILRPWHTSHVIGTDTRSFGTKTVQATLPTSMEGFGPAHLKVALFHPLFAPTGCRLPRAIDEYPNFAVGHANCREGYFRKVLLLAWYGLWNIRYYDDKFVYKVIMYFTVWLIVRRFLLTLYGPSGNRDHSATAYEDEEQPYRKDENSTKLNSSPKREYHTGIDIGQGNSSTDNHHIRHRENE